MTTALVKFAFAPFAAIVAGVALSASTVGASPGDEAPGGGMAELHAEMVSNSPEGARMHAQMVSESPARARMHATMVSGRTAKLNRVPVVEANDTTTGLRRE